MNMRYYYERSIIYLKIYIKKYKRIPEIEEWSKYAIQNNLLSCESIKYIYGKDFKSWCKNISTNF